MDQQQIKTWMDLMTASDLSELEFSQDGWTLRLARATGHRTAVPASAPRVPSPSSTPMPPTPAPAGLTPPPANAAPSTLVAPLYGVVHLSASPTEPAFVRVGDVVQAGQPLCVIEAMKVFNEVRAEKAGVLQAILVVSGQEVEGGAPLFQFA